MAALSRSNKHLAGAAKRRKAVLVTVATSSAIEGIHAPFKAETTRKRKSRAGRGAVG